MNAARVVIAIIGLAASALQVVVGGLSSMGLGAPGVGPEADWVPGVLSLEGITIIPLGFGLAAWGSPWGLRLAAACALVSALVAVIATILLADAGNPEEVLTTSLIPGAALAITIWFVAQRRR